tara:strand:+ start:1036 stop:1971 length:936 start_codon:yes stop_codon:yes gene_type:complete
METSPWVEKYRPNKFEDIVLTPINKKILENIIEFNYFPNLLFYGPPGTGKTTTIINLIDKYQETYNQKNKGLIIHLNASDDRGIDIIRNQIYQFVNTKTLFGNGMKFIILDEVDYMTKNAQQALHYLIQKYNTQIRFCLICNYISRIDSALQNEFIRLRFCQLPQEDIFMFLKNISEKENLSVSDSQLQNIRSIFKSDIRSMINFLQSNHTQIDGNSLKIISAEFWEKLLEKFKESDDNVKIFIQDSCVLFNINIVTFLKKFLLFIIRQKTDKITSKFLKLTKNIMHNIETNEMYLLNYFVLEFLDLQNEL